MGVSTRVTPQTTINSSIPPTCRFWTKGSQFTQTCPRHPSPIAAGLLPRSVSTGIPALELFKVLEVLRSHQSHALGSERTVQWQGGFPRRLESPQGRRGCRNAGMSTSALSVSPTLGFISEFSFS